jgi:hypothetical protein
MSQTSRVHLLNYQKIPSKKLKRKIKNNRAKASRIRQAIAVAQSKRTALLKTKENLRKWRKNK